LSYGDLLMKSKSDAIPKWVIVVKVVVCLFFAILVSCACDCDFLAGGTLHTCMALFMVVRATSPLHVLVGLTFLGGAHPC